MKLGLRRSGVASSLALVMTGGAISSLGGSSAASSVPVLGVTHTFGSHSSGWGQVRPRHLYNGGDASGDIFQIAWSDWGGATAHGRGKNSIFSPKGGYYREPVTIRLRATDVGVCRSTGQFAYRRLLYSEPSRPGGPFGPWRFWTSYHRNLCAQRNA